MVLDIDSLRKIRKQLDLTQYAFAKEAGLSQSMIAKIEAGRLDPTYSNVKKIEQAINNLTNTEDNKTAENIMNRKGIFCDKKTKLKQIANLFTKHNISQIPILDNHNVMGLITESNLLEQRPIDIKTKEAKEVMGDAPPIVAKNTKLEIIISLLKFYPMVLVKEKGKLKGLITKSDIIKELS